MSSCRAGFREGRRVRRNMKRFAHSESFPRDVATMMRAFSWRSWLGYRVGFALPFPPSRANRIRFGILAAQNDLTAIANRKPRRRPPFTDELTERAYNRTVGRAVSNGLRKAADRLEQLQRKAER